MFSHPYLLSAEINTRRAKLLAEADHRNLIKIAIRARAERRTAAAALARESRSPKSVGPAGNLAVCVPHVAGSAR